MQRIMYACLTGPEAGMCRAHFVRSFVRSFVRTFEVEEGRKEGEDGVITACHPTHFCGVASAAFQIFFEAWTDEGTKGRTRRESRPV